MTQEEKSILFKELSARLPYGIKVQYTAGDGITTIDNCNVDQISIKSECIAISDTDSNFVWRSIDSCKLYLRPMSSMTEEERKEYNLLTPIVEVVFPCDAYPLIDWLNKKQFDYRGLIPKGLALVAPEGMYNNKE